MVSFLKGIKCSEKQVLISKTKQNINMKIS